MILGRALQNNKMEYRKLGSTDVELSVITFGAWAIGGWMWGGNEKKDSIRAIQAAVDSGITSIDTAPAYGQGLSEELVSEALQGTARDKVQLLTKYGLRWDRQDGQFFFTSKDNDGKDLDMYRYAGKDSIVEECEASLRRLKTDYIDLYQIHWSDPTTPIEETMEAILQLKQQGKIREAGVCNYTAAEMQTAEKILPLASNQVPFSMVQQDIKTELVPYCVEHGKSIIAYSPMQRGLLTGKIKPDHHFGEGDSRADNKYYTAENINRTNAFLDKLRPLAEEKGASLAQLVLRWTVDQPGITIALAGARNAEQSIQNAAAASVKLSKEDLMFIEGELSQLQLVFDK
jgi:aryl-alcohol dehydrogenase-like predicted oxidoreductase